MPRRPNWRAAFTNGYGYYASHLNESLPAAVGLAVLDVIEEERLVTAARDEGAWASISFRIA